MAHLAPLADRTDSVLGKVRGRKACLRPAGCWPPHRSEGHLGPDAQLLPFPQFGGRTYELPDWAYRTRGVPALHPRS